MKELNPILQAACVVAGVLIELTVSHFYGGKVVLISLIVLFVFLIGWAQWNKRKNKS